MIHLDQKHYKRGQMESFFFLFFWQDGLSYFCVINSLARQPYFHISRDICLWMETRVIEYSRVSNNRTASISGKLCFILLAKKDNLLLLKIELILVSIWMLNMWMESWNDSFLNYCTVIRYYSASVFDKLIVILHELKRCNEDQVRKS